jgi:hypothetical protein
MLASHAGPPFTLRDGYRLLMPSMRIRMKVRV